ncbi:MAG: hypothetical protein IPJ54_00185 [Saprospiraceae bacterium]|nr:hypothetical protein [Saprospiraceae bacterium]
MLNYLHLYFSLKINPTQIADFRGAFISLAMRSNMDDVALSYLDNRQYNNGEAGALITRHPRCNLELKMDAQPFGQLMREYQLYSK